MYSKVLIPLDGSNTAEKVLPYARYLARKLKLPVELLVVIDIAEMATHTTAEKARYLDTLVEDGVRASTSYLRGIATTFMGGDVTWTVETGRAEELIVERGGADGNALIAMATHGRSGLNRFLLGSVAEKVLRSTTNPLLLIRATGDAKATGEATLRSIVVPLDGSALAEGVLPTVASMAKELDLQVVLFRAYHLPYNTYGADDTYMTNYEEMIAAVREDANAYLERKVLDVKRLGVAKVSTLGKEGFAGDEIITLGRKTPDNLIAMCSHGRTGVRRFVLGSVTETVVRHSGDPVLVLRAR